LSWVWQVRRGDAESSSHLHADRAGRPGIIIDQPSCYDSLVAICITPGTAVNYNSIQFFFALVLPRSPSVLDCADHCILYHRGGDDRSRHLLGMPDTHMFIFYYAFVRSSAGRLSPPVGGNDLRQPRR
jgi:hypothetical protein